MVRTHYNPARDPSRGLGIHGLTLEQRRENLRKSCMSNRFTPYELKEILYIKYLPEFGITNKRIADYLNLVFHSGRNARTERSIKYARRRYIKN